MGWTRPIHRTFSATVVCMATEVDNEATVMLAQSDSHENAISVDLVRVDFEKSSLEDKEAPENGLSKINGEGIVSDGKDDDGSLFYVSEDDNLLAESSSDDSSAYTNSDSEDEEDGQVMQPMPLVDDQMKEGRDEVVFDRSLLVKMKILKAKKKLREQAYGTKISALRKTIDEKLDTLKAIQTELAMSQERVARESKDPSESRAGCRWMCWRRTKKKTIRECLDDQAEIFRGKIEEIQQQIKDRDIELVEFRTDLLVFKEIEKAFASNEKELQLTKIENASLKKQLEKAEMRRRNETSYRLRAVKQLERENADLAKEVHQQNIEIKSKIIMNNELKKQNETCLNKIKETEVEMKKVESDIKRFRNEVNGLGKKHTKLVEEEIETHSKHVRELKAELLAKDNEIAAFKEQYKKYKYFEAEKLQKNSHTLDLGCVEGTVEGCFLLHDNQLVLPDNNRCVSKVDNGDETRMTLSKKRDPAFAVDAENLEDNPKANITKSNENANDVPADLGIFWGTDGKVSKDLCNKAKKMVTICTEEWTI